MSKKRVISLLVAMMLSVSMFAGCNGDSSTPSSQEPQSSAAENSGDESKEPEGEGVSGTINFMHWKGEEKETWDEIIANFQDANPDATVEMEILPEDQFYTTLQARVMAGEGLDVFLINPGSRFNTFLKADAFMDLSDQAFLDNLNESFLTSGQSDGKQYIVPLSKSFVCLFYNKDIFADLSLEVPKTWDEFLAACEAIKQSGTEVIATGMADSYTSTWPFAETIVQYSEDLDIYRKLAAGEAKLTDDLFKKVLAPWKELADKGYIMANASGAKYDTSVTMFATGKAAMLNNGTWALGSVMAANPDLNFGVMLFPAPDGNVVAGISPAQAITVSKTTANEETSLKFLEFVLSKESMELYGNNTVQEVPNKDAVLENDKLTEAGEVGNSGDIYPHFFSEWSQIDQDIVSEITTRAMNGEDIDTILSDAQTKLESLDLEVE